NTQLHVNWRNVMKRSSSRRSRGFTLIEVLLVLVILVILASLAVVNVLSVQKKASINAAKVQINAFSGALDTYFLDVGSFPSTQAGLNALRTRPQDLQDPEKWSGPYLDKEIPLDPWSKPYQYQYPGRMNGDKYDISTVTPDGVTLCNWTEGVQR